MMIIKVDWVNLRIPEMKKIFYLSEFTHNFSFNSISFCDVEEIDEAIRHSSLSLSDFTFAS